MENLHCYSVNLLKGITSPYAAFGHPDQTGKK